MLCIYFSSITNSALFKLIQDKPNIFFIPEITYSIANAPNNKPNTLWITLNKDKLIISTSLEDNHIQTPAKITESITGKKLITLLINSGSDFSAISMVIVIAPGPAISGIAKGKVANDMAEISSIAESAKFCLLSSRFSKTISNAMKMRNKPPIILKEFILIPIPFSNACPNNEKKRRITNDINVALK